MTRIYLEENEVGYSNSSNELKQEENEETTTVTAMMERNEQSNNQQKQEQHEERKDQSLDDDNNDEDAFQSWLQQSLPIDKVIQLDYWPPKNTTIKQYYDWSLPTHEIYKVPIDTNSDHDNNNNSNRKSYCFSLEDCRAMYDQNQIISSTMSSSASSSTSTTTSNGDGIKRDFDNNNNNNNNTIFTPTFCVARSRLDYTYHTHVVKNRQYLQDAILKRIVAGMNSNNGNTSQTTTTTTITTSLSTSTEGNYQITSNDETGTKYFPTTSLTSKLQQHMRPWIVFTAGPMGVGKGYVITQLQQQHLLNVSKSNNFITIDPDLIKFELPEMIGYIQMDRTTAATKLHRESTQMADIIFEYAIDHSMSILVDGSLRDVDYHLSLFERIRSDYQQYQIAIIHITASREDIYERAASRAQRTGRVIPKEILDESIEQVPHSVELLAPHADAVHVIANPLHQPIRLLSSTYRTKYRRKRSTSTTRNQGLEQVDENEWTTTIRTSTSWEEFAQSWYTSYQYDATVNETGVCDNDDILATKHTDVIEANGSPVHYIPGISVQKRSYKQEINVPQAETTNKNDPAATLHHVTSMSQMYHNDTCHEIANNIWLRSYPNFCARCALSSDTQCGICIHNTHICACNDCRPSNMKACSSN